MKIRTRLTLWYVGMMASSLLLMIGVLHYELVGESERHLPPESPQTKIVDVLLFYGLPTSVMLIVGGAWLVNRALRPVEVLTAGAERVHAGNLSERFPPGQRGDELDRLASVFNSMLGRIEAGTAVVREFTLHASHELRTPLTILSAEIELALRDPATVGTERNRLLSQWDEICRLSRLVDALGLVAKADYGLPVIAKESVSLSPLVRQAVGNASMLGGRSGVTVELVRCDEAALRGDSAALRRILLNLLDNAIKHNDAGGWVRVRLESDRVATTLRVSNSAPPIAPEVAARLFQRFVRGDSRAAGSGLGLNIVKMLVEAHDGTIGYTTPEPDIVEFTVQLPLSARPGA